MTTISPNGHGSRHWSRQQRPGVQDTVRTEGGLDPAQHARPGRTEIGCQQAGLQPPDAVMVGDGPSSVGIYSGELISVRIRVYVATVQPVSCSSRE